MTKNKKGNRIYYLSLVFFVMVLLCAYSNCALSEKDSGTVGNLTWSLTDDNTLIISGTGILPNIDQGSDQPWINYSSIIESVVVENGVTRIGNLQIYGLENMKSISLPNSLTSIGNFCLSDCSKLASVSLPSSLEKIGYSCFCNCDLITTIHLPASLTSVSYDCFLDNDLQTSFTVDKDNQHYCAVDGVLFTKDMTRLHSYPFGNKRTQYTIPIGVSEIGESVFNGIKRLKSVILPDTLRSIHVCAFSGTGLTNVILPDGLTFMNSDVFIETDINEVAIPESVSFMGNHVFPKNALIKCVKDSYADTWAQENGYKIEYIPHHHILEKEDRIEPTCYEEGREEYWYCLYCDALFSDENGEKGISTPCVIPITHTLVKHDGIEATSYKEGIEEYWECSDCGKLFSDVEGQNEITEPIVIPKLKDENIVESGECGYEAYYTLDKNGLLTIVGTGDINSYAFEDRKDIKQVVVSKGIATIGSCAFSKCTQIENVDLPDSLINIGINAFYHCDSLKNIIIPGSIVITDPSIFVSCVGLEKVEIKEGFTKIDQMSFVGCSNLKEVMLPLSIETIDAAAFQDCNSLTTITLPDSLTYISDIAFGSSNNLSNIIIPTCNSYAHNWAKNIGYGEAIKVQRHQNPVSNADGTLTCTACGDVIDLRVEKLKAYVTRCYRIILNREPDAGGLVTWLNELTSGRKTASEIIDRFVNSPEYLSKNYNYGDSVDILYQAMLGRNADEAGKANWVKKLENGQTLAHVINGFCFSNEFRGLCDSYGIKAGFVNIPETDTTAEGKIKAFVQRCYRIILDREADPSGMQTWYEQLSSGKKAAAEIIDRFVNSPEFSGKNYNSGDSVEILYKAMLGRGSDAAGKANWVSKLDAGQPFAVVINGFCVSKEFTGICASYGIKPGSVTVQPLSGVADEEALSMLALNAKEPITRRSETKPNRVEIINPSDTIDMNIGTAVQAVYINEEKAKEFISRCYRVILGRDASAAELENWIGQMVNGTKSPDQIARGFLFSNEFKAKNLGNEDLVKILYRVYMNREADPEGLKTWTEKLDNGTSLKDLLDIFSKTNEFKKVVSEMSK